MNHIVELAKEIKNRDNPDVDEAIIGKLMSVNPITISLFNGQAIYTEGVNCYICENLKGISGNIDLENVVDHGTISTKFTVTRNLNVGDEVLCIPTAGGQKYFILDKVVG